MPGTPKGLSFGHEEWIATIHVEELGATSITKPGEASNKHDMGIPSLPVSIGEGPCRRCDTERHRPVALQ